MAKLNLPPGAVLVDDGTGSSGMKLPPGATLVSGGTPTTTPTFTTSSISAAPEFGSKAWFKEKLWNSIDKGSNMLPAAGGFAGGVIGVGAGVPSGPGAIATGVGGAALGGAAGEAGRQLIRRGMGWDAPQTSLDAAEDIGIEGAKQGAFELGGQVVGRLGKMMAPKMAEVAAAPGKRLLKSVPENVNLGDTILNQSTGVRPSTIVGQLGNKITKASNEVDLLTSNARDAGVTVPLNPARDAVQNEMKSAVAKNSPNYIKDVEKVRDQLTNEYGPGGKPVMKTVTTTKPGAGFVPSNTVQTATQTPVALPAAVDPVRARQLRQGIDMDISTWNPESQSNIAPLQERVRGAISSGLHDAVPATAPLDRAMTSLIPAKQAMWNVSYNPDVTGRLFNRVARPTGALTGAGFGAYEGQKSGGPGGAIVGGLAGLAFPELLASPTGQMIVARGLNSRALPAVVSNTPRVLEGLLKPTAEDEKKRRLANQQ